jgi:glyoxylase-like metal-dependent hydrolase (beta-lactamase superfamily II)
LAAYNQYEHGIIRIKVPVPFPLQWVNAYVLQDEAGYVVVDPGLNTEQARELWLQVLKELNIEPGMIRRVILTHHHPDHYGLAGWMQELTNGQVFLSSAGHALAGRLWGEGETLSDELCALFAAHGLPRDKQLLMHEHMKSFIPLVSPQPREVRYLEAGDEWSAGELRFRTMSVSGHAYGHLIFLDERNKLMLCGDHVLPRISPNISYLPDEDPDPLHSFLTGLDKLAACGALDAVYPGHRDPFRDLAGRVQELKAHHARRLEQMAGLLQQPATAYEVCRAMFGERLSIHQLRFAMSETIAHLRYLERRQYIRLEQQGDTCVYASLRPFPSEG